MSFMYEICTNQMKRLIMAIVELTQNECEYKFQILDVNGSLHANEKLKQIQSL
jgi:hypothetical protein